MPLLLRTFSKRTLMIFSAIIFAVFTIFGAAVDNITYMVACRFIVGISFGIVNVLYVSIIADVYVDDNKRAKFMSVFMFLQAAFGALFAQVSGILAVTDWHHSFYIYLISIVTVILCILFLPRKSDLVEANTAAQPGEGEQADTAADAAVGSRGFSAQFIVLAIVMFFVAVVFYLFFTFCSVYVAQNALGDEAFAGTVALANTVCSALMCLAVGPLYAKFGGKTGIILLALYTIGFLALFLSPTAAGAIVGSGLIGAGYGAFFTFVLAYIPGIVAPSKMDFAIGIMTSACFIATAAAPFLITFLQTLSGGTVNPIYLVCGIVCVVLIVLTAVVTLSKKKTAA